MAALKRDPSRGVFRPFRKHRRWLGFVATLATALPSLAPLSALAAEPAPAAWNKPEVPAELATIGSAKPVESSPDTRLVWGARPTPEAAQLTTDAQRLDPEQAAAAAALAARNKGKAGDAQDPVRIPARKQDATAEPPPDAPPQEAAVVAPGLAVEKSGASSQAIHTPKGAGTLEGMGESFSTQLSTGVATLTVPFALPAARGSAQPSLSLSYSSASGFGVAGMGWDTGVPFIARQTDRGTPRYGDQPDYFVEQDRFAFNGGQELVPICTVTGSGATLTCAGALAGEVMPPWSAGSQYFRARVEGSFLRFFWSADHSTWRVQDKSGVTMEFGAPLDTSGDRSGLEVNPEDATQIFRWNLVRQYDTQGEANPTSPTVKPTPNNIVVYRYRPSGNAAYLSDIYDTPPAAAPGTTDLSRYAHHTHLEYADRSDPSVSYRSGWKVERSLRLVRVDVTSKTFNFGDVRLRQLVRRYHLTYRPGQHTSLLESVQMEGRCSVEEKDAPSEAVSGLVPATSCQRLPAMTFEYTHVDPKTTNGTPASADLVGYEGFDERIREITDSPPHSIDEELTELFDVNGDALPDLMVTAPGLYGNGFGKFVSAPGGLSDQFGAAASMAVQGALGANAGTLKLSNANVAVLDADGDGLVDLLHMPAVKTYAIYSLVAGNWMGRNVTTANQQDARIDLGRDALTTRVLDANGDGLVDVIVTNGTEISTYFSLGRYAGGKDQFGSPPRDNPLGAISNEPVRSCLPWSGSAVDFGDQEIHLGDLNGDGLQDIVRLQRGQIRYWPGRGNGFWGTGRRSDCVAGTFGADSDVLMSESPHFNDIDGASLRVDDVNGDGLDDLVQVNIDSVDVWLNIDGVSWTPRHVIASTPSSPAFANRVRLVDINGSGTRDILWADSGKYRYIDLQGGTRPWLLQTVKNGLGKSTTVEYSTSTSEMLVAERGLGIGTPWSSPWTSKMPIVAHVVKRVTESDNFVFAGSGPNQLVTEYEYRDPVYDGRQREFRGFKRARSKRIGDANSPTDYSESQFLLGECVDETANGKDDCADLSLDNPREALKGLPVVTERYSDTGVYLSTGATTYRLRRLYVGRDGREVRQAFQSAQRQVAYDTALWAPSTGSTSLPLIEIETAIDTAFAPLTNPLSQPVGLVFESLNVPVRSTTNTATIESRSQVDYFGNQLVAIALGCTSGAACPVADVGIAANEAIYSFTEPTRPTGDETGWLFRTKDAYVKGSLGAHTAVRDKTTTTYDTKGSPTNVQAQLSGTGALDRRHRTLTGASAVAPLPGNRSSDGPLTVATYQYDAFGNLTQQTGPNGRCRSLAYDSNSVDYQQLVTSETIYTTGCGGTGLTTGAAYDRGLIKPTVVTAPNAENTSIVYDQLGRLTSFTAPRPTGATPVPQPSLSLIYTLATPTQPYSTIETRAQDTATVDDSGTLWSIAFIDGMGRTRLTRSEADPTGGLDAGAAIAAGVVRYDAKGAVARSYRPEFTSSAANDPPSASAPASFARAEYDAFGRVLKAFDLATDLNGVQTLQNAYHALSVDAWDSADLGLGTPVEHQGTFATVRSDGHGRPIVATERVGTNGADARDIRTQYLPTGEPEVVTRVHVGVATDSPVVRWMRYDTLGRLVLNVDPHTTLNFDPSPAADASVTPTGLRAWRYAYDDAGDLVGTSDARGCGVNYTYDGAGRLLSEDYSPCEASHAPYSAPNFTNHQGIEVYYQYDSIPSAFSALFGGPFAATNLNGRLAAVYDRAGIRYLGYDGRGRAIRDDRRLANPDPTVVDPATRYRGRWYSATSAYDAMDRAVRQSTGAISPELLDGSGKSEVQLEYSARGTLKRVFGSYGDLITSVKRSADGLITQIAYGDAASTTAANTYDSRLRLQTSQVARAIPPIWSTPPSNYLPAPTPGASTPTTFQLILKDESYTYDVVGNPITITDFRIPSEWPSGAKRASRTIQYDDLYRVKQVDYAYDGGADAFNSPFAPERAGGSDARQSSNFAPHLLPAQRVTRQTYTYDWLGSLSSADDDAHVMWDRGVGPITTYTSTGMPYRWKNAGDSALASWAGVGAADALAYDETGNLLDLQVARTGTCTNGTTNCGLRFTYAYDEVGRLNAAKRIEGATTKADLRYTYDFSDDRTLKGDYSVAQSYFTAYVFDTLELRRTTYNTTTGDFAATALTETPFLIANDARIGRVVYEGASDGEPRLATNRLHTFIEVHDPLGSTSIAIDKATGELAERTTYQPYGATESDYRPDRWKGFREDYRFTGKEEDIEVGLTYFGRRFLSASLGRWVSPDPLAVHMPGEADLNLYAYVHGRVLIVVDPLGLEDCGKGGGGACNSGQGATEGKSGTSDPDRGYESGFETGKHNREIDDQAAAMKAKALENFVVRIHLGQSESDSAAQLEKERGDIKAWAKAQRAPEPEGPTKQAEGYDYGYSSESIKDAAKEIAAVIVPGPKGSLGKGGPRGSTGRIPERASPAPAARGAAPRNAHLAGQPHPVTRVPFDGKGYPDFKASGAVKAEVKISPTGTRAGDFKAANEAAGFKETPRGMTWHHHQDGTTMQLVPRDIHMKTGHTGGFSP